MIPAWLAHHWFQLIQTLGIVAGLTLSGWSAWAQRRALRIDGLVRLTEGHRALWQEVFDKPSLLRVTDPDANLEAQPITGEERLFVMLLVLHLNAAFEATRAGTIAPIWGLQSDIRALFALPIPRAVWNDAKDFQSPEFNALIDAELVPQGVIRP